MKFIIDLVEKVKPNFVKGGKYEKFYPVFESFETLLLVQNHKTKFGSHIRDAVDLKRTMITVILAMVPALLFGMWNVGYQALGAEATLLEAVGFGALRVVPLIIVSYAVGLGIEFYYAFKRGHEVNEGYLVSGMLIPLVLPVTTPLWMVGVATVFAVIIGKEAFGGTGMNLLNPALTARAFLFFAYPSSMSGEIWVAQGGLDGLSGATALGDAAAGQMQKLPSLVDSFLGLHPGSIGETSTLVILLGALVLITTGVGSWKIMLSATIGGFLTALLLNSVGSTTNPVMNIPAIQHLCLGGFAFGVVFMTTDPVTAAQTEKGKWIYGFLIGLLAILIRTVNPAYPEGVMLAILFMNVFAPLIDHYVVEANIAKRAKRANIAKA